MSQRHHLVSLWLIFFINGSVMASWSPRIPEVAAALDVGDAALGIALLGFAAGAIPAMLCAGHLTRWVSPALVSLLSATVFSLGLPVIATAPNLVALFTALFGMGVAGGLCDITMNLTGVRIEHRLRSGVLGRLHAGFSLGVVAGGVGALVATALGASVAGHFAVAAAVLVVLAATAAPGLLRAGGRRPERERVPETARSPDGPRFTSHLPAAIAVLAISGLLLEGVITDWSALLLTRDLGATATQGALALTLFSVAMVGSRAVTDLLADRLGETVILCAGAVMAATAMTIGMLSAVPGIVVGSIVVIGLAIGPVFPITLSRASRFGDPAASIARISVVGYTAGLVGPLLIGVISSAVGLPWTVTGAVLAGSLGILLALRPASRGDETGTAP